VLLLGTSHFKGTALLHRLFEKITIIHSAKGRKPTSEFVGFAVTLILLHDVHRPVIVTCTATLVSQAFSDGLIPVGSIFAVVWLSVMTEKIVVMTKTI